MLVSTDKPKKAGIFAPFRYYAKKLNMYQFSVLGDGTLKKLHSSGNPLAIDAGTISSRGPAIKLVESVDSFVHIFYKDFYGRIKMLAWNPLKVPESRDKRTGEEGLVKGGSPNAKMVMNSLYYKKQPEDDSWILGQYANVSQHDFVPEVIETGDGSKDEFAPDFTFNFERLSVFTSGNRAYIEFVDKICDAKAENLGTFTINDTLVGYIEGAPPVSSNNT